MQPYVEPAETPKRKLSPLTIIMIAIFAVCGIFLLVPSSRSARVSQAKERLNGSYKGIPSSEFQPLLNEEMIHKNAMGTINPKHLSMIYVFAPNPKDTTASQFISEMSYMPSYYMDETPDELILLAPDPTSTGWSYLAKVWLALAIQKKSTDEVKSLAEQLTYTGSTTMTRLKAIWGTIPVGIQKRAEVKLEENRQFAKLYKTSRRFFYDGNGENFEISMPFNLYEFFADYRMIHPNRRAVQ